MFDISSTDRRSFLKFGAIMMVPLVAGGCDGGDGSPEKITTPPAETGNRNRLQDRADKAKTATK